MISSLQRKVKSTPVTSEATGFEIFMVFSNAQRAELLAVGGWLLAWAGHFSC